MKYIILKIIISSKFNVEYYYYYLQTIIIGLDFAEITYFLNYNIFINILMIIIFILIIKFVNFFKICNDKNDEKSNYFLLITIIKTDTVIVLCDFCKSLLIKTKKLENDRKCSID